MRLTNPGRPYRFWQEENVRKSISLNSLKATWSQISSITCLTNQIEFSTISPSFWTLKIAAASFIPCSQYQEVGSEELQRYKKASGNILLKRKKTWSPWGLPLVITTKYKFAILSLCTSFNLNEADFQS